MQEIVDLAVRVAVPRWRGTIGNMHNKLQAPGSPAGGRRHRSISRIGWVVGRKSPPVGAGLGSLRIVELTRQPS